MKIKTCVICKWFIDNKNFNIASRCASPEVKLFPDLVTGKVDLPFCQLVRMDGNQWKQEIEFL